PDDRANHSDRPRDFLGLWRSASHGGGGRGPRPARKAPAARLPLARRAQRLLALLPRRQLSSELPGGSLAAGNLLPRSRRNLGRRRQARAVAQLSAQPPPLSFALRLCSHRKSARLSVPFCLSHFP